MNVHLKPYDFVAFAVAIAIIGTFSWHAYSSRGAAAVVEIRGEGQRLLYPLDQDRTLTVRGPLGESVVEISAGRVRVVSSPCRDQICVLAGWISSAGQWAACLPNRVFVTVQGPIDDTPDAFTY